MHETKSAGAQLCQHTNGWTRRGCEAGGPEDVLCHERGSRDLLLGQGWASTEGGEQVAAQQRLGCLLEEQAGIPAVGNMWRFDPANPLAAQVQDLAILKRAGWAVGEVVYRDDAAHSAVSDLRVRSSPEPGVHGAAFVGLDVPERDPPQPCQWHHAFYRCGDQRKHRAWTGVEQERLLRIDEELVEH